MRVALFVTCLNDALFPEAGRATVQCWSGSGTRSSSRWSRPAAARCTPTPATCEALPLVAPLRRRLRRVRRGRRRRRARASAMVRDQHAHDRRAARRPEALAARRRRRPRTIYELSEFLVDVLGIDDVGAYFPHRVTYHPTCHSLRMLQRRRRARCGCCERSAGSTSSSCRRRRVLRVRRHVRDEERRHLGGDAGRQDAPRARHRRRGLCAGDNSCLMHIGGGLDRMRAGVRTVHLAEILASTDERRRR